MIPRRPVPGLGQIRTISATARDHQAPHRIAMSLATTELTAQRLEQARESLLVQVEQLDRRLAMLAEQRATLVHLHPSLRHGAPAPVLANETAPAIFAY